MLHLCTLWHRHTSSIHQPSLRYTALNTGCCLIGPPKQLPAARDKCLVHDGTKRAQHAIHQPRAALFAQAPATPVWTLRHRLTSTATSLSKALKALNIGRC